MAGLFVIGWCSGLLLVAYGLLTSLIGLFVLLLGVCCVFSGWVVFAGLFWCVADSLVLYFG